MRSIKNKRAWRLGVLVLLVLAGCLITFGIQGFLRQYSATHNPHPTVTQTIITNSIDRPDETPPTDSCAAYSVAADHPERINLPTIGVSGCIEQVGIDQYGAIAVPNNIYTAAWYVKSALPGQPGLSVIDGHISGYYNVDGIFQHLDQLKSGDTFTITLGSGRVLSYKVYDEQSIPLDNAVRVLLTKSPGVESQLNLITCGGQYDKNTKLYTHRIIVSAALLDV